MSRSRHTAPARVRAPRRVRAPYERRGRGDPSREYAPARSLKELGVVTERAPTPRAGEGPATLPRVHGGHAGRRYIHPAGAREIADVLRFFGEPC